MESLAELLEDELKEAVEVKNEKSLHRYIVLLSENMISKQARANEQTVIEKKFDEAAAERRQNIIELREGFKRTDQRFEDLIRSSDTRFDELLKHSDSRFGDINNRFGDTNKKFDELLKHSDSRFDEINNRFGDTNKRFDDVNKRFDELLKHSDARFDDMNRRFEDMNKRFTASQWMIGIGFVIISTLIALFRFFG